jgi:ribonuclease VapC
MVIDASALVAVLEGEPDARHYADAIEAALIRFMSPINLIEVHMVVRSRGGEAGVRRLDLLLNEMAVEIVPIDDAQTKAARDAFDRFGKGRHAAGLNLADCFAYALSKSSGEPLLFKGGDFAKTDVLVAG